MVPAIAHSEVISATTAALPNSAKPAANEIVVTVKRLDPARRMKLSGGRVIHIDRSALESRPGGRDAGFKRMLLQTPGVTKGADNGDGITMRNEHLDIQYRLNGIIIPESFSAYGTLVDDRIAETVDMVTGAQSAKLGLRTSGLVALETAAGKFEPEADISVYGGSNNYLRTSATVIDAIGDLNVFLSGTYIHEGGLVYASTAGKDIIHDTTDQWRGFGYASYQLTDSSRLMALGGSETVQYRIPDSLGQVIDFAPNGQTLFDSTGLNQQQSNQTHFATLAYQYSGDVWNLLVAPFVRYARAHYAPDISGTRLSFAGQGIDFVQSSLAWGGQVEASWRFDDSHEISFGSYFSQERVTGSSVNRIVSYGSNGNLPIALTSLYPVRLGTTVTTWSVYAQDRWQIAETLTFNYGLRYDHFSAQISQSQFSPRINIVWEPSDTITTHLGYARNFTPPPPELLGGGIVAAFRNTVEPFINATAFRVLPERQHSFDIGASKTVGGLTIGLDGYVKLAKDLLDFQMIGETLIETPFNYAKGYNWGVELSLAYGKGPFSGYFNLARGQQKARRVTTNSSLFDSIQLADIGDRYIFTDHSQKWAISGGNSFDVGDHFGTLNLSFNFDYGSGQTANTPLEGNANGRTYPSYLQFNFGLAQELGHKPKRNPVVRLDMTIDDNYPIRNSSVLGQSQITYRSRVAMFAGLRVPF
ncbi:MAG: TonB-dependent receptor [Acetobacteraceae bacterium]|nr:TonB-dependent receptor [Acetobacteraceae bacterium]